MGFIRELIGGGTVFSGTPLEFTVTTTPLTVMLLPPGGFFVFGVLVALANKVAVRLGKKPVKKLGCDGCHGDCANCGSSEKEGA